MSNPLGKQFLLQLNNILIVGALVVGGFFTLPIILGFGYAFGGFIPYGVVCNKSDTLFTGEISERDYTTFLMNRGCDADKEVRRLVVEKGWPSLVDLISAKLAGKSVDVNSTNVSSDTFLMIAGSIRATTRTFRWPEIHRDDCPVDQYCATQTFWGKDVFGRLFAWISNSYFAWFIPIFSDSIFSGAGVLISVLSYGPIFATLLFLAYSVGTIVMGILVTRLINKFIGSEA